MCVYVFVLRVGVDVDGFRCTQVVQNGPYAAVNEYQTACLRHSVEFRLRALVYGIQTYKLRNAYGAVTEER